MTASTGDQDVVDILTTDHHEVLALVGQIPTADPEQRRDMADTVIAELMRHSGAEEMYVYPAMKDHLPDGESQVKHEKKLAPTRPLPAAPHSELFHEVVGPGVAWWTRCATS
jgi:hemerythrin superfamily protein